MDLTAKAFAFPFTAILAQPAVRLALTLAAVNPRIGGVLIRGEKGAAKSTAVRALASLLPGVPFVELPLGATEERVTGTLDVGEALRTGNRRFEPGLLARAHGGILSIDEVNLLPDHLVDLILDASAMGVNHVERDGVSHAHPAVFILAGTMNPEEGELRPQLLDRFALSVTVEPVRDVATRSAIVRQRMAFDTDPAGFVDAYKQAEIALRDNLSRARGAVGSVTIPDDVMDRIVGLCLGIGVDGMRADLATCRAAQALAALEGRSEVTIEDVRLVAPFTLAHRRRRWPLDSYGVDPTEIDRHLSPDATRTMGSAHVSGPQADVETDPQEPDLSGETAQPSQTTGLSGHRVRFRQVVDPVPP